MNAFAKIFGGNTEAKAESVQAIARPKQTTNGTHAAAKRGTKYPCVVKVAVSEEVAYALEMAAGLTESSVSVYLRNVIRVALTNSGFLRTGNGTKQRMDVPK